ncbi:MAG: hypothetical protein LBD04_02765 [Synergistaceae bacterium]|jgi:hypothetical protein|nr:hypothetical protein [Synergistaceae bacterium]
MNVYIDGQDYSEILKSADAASILNVVQSETSRNGRVVTEIRVDDVAMDEEAFLNLTGGLSASFSTQLVRDLVVDSLDEAIKYIPRLKKGLEEIALHFEKNETAAGQGKLADAAEGLDWLLSVFQKCTTLLAVGEEANGGENLKAALAADVGRLAALHGEGKFLQMALAIRQKLVPEVGEFALHVQRLRDLGSFTQ